MVENVVLLITSGRCRLEIGHFLLFVIVIRCRRLVRRLPFTTLCHSTWLVSAKKGNKLLQDTISQGTGGVWPAYDSDWPCSMQKPSSYHLKLLSSKAGINVSQISASSFRLRDQAIAV